MWQNVRVLYLHCLKGLCNVGGCGSEYKRSEIVYVMENSSSMYHRHQNKCYPQRCQTVRKTAGNCSTLAEMKFDRCNKFDLCYYEQVG